MTQIAHAQYGNPSVNTTQEQLEECKKLDIAPEQCSDNTILAKLGRCLGPNCGIDTPPPTLDTITVSIMIGSGIALVTGIFAVRKIRKARKKD